MMLRMALFVFIALATAVPLDNRNTVTFRELDPACPQGDNCECVHADTTCHELGYSYCDCGDTCDARRCCCKTQTRDCVRHSLAEVGLRDSERRKRDNLDATVTSSPETAALPGSTDDGGSVMTSTKRPASPPGSETQSTPPTTTAPARPATTCPPLPVPQMHALCSLSGKTCNEMGHGYADPARCEGRCAPHECCCRQAAQWYFFYPPDSCDVIVGDPIEPLCGGCYPGNCYEDDTAYCEGGACCPDGPGNFCNGNVTDVLCASITFCTDLDLRYANPAHCGGNCRGDQCCCP